MKLGDIVQVSWDDAARVTNQPLEAATPAKMVNSGALAKINDKYVVVCNGLCLDSGKDVSGDFTVIPRGCVTEIIVLKKYKSKKS